MRLTYKFNNDEKKVDIDKKEYLIPTNVEFFFREGDSIYVDSGDEVKINQLLIESSLGVNIKILDYSEHALNSGSNAQAAAYIHMMDMDTKKVTYGVGISSNITRASIRAIFSALNRIRG